MKYTFNPIFMERAIQLSEIAGIKENSGNPFGAVIVKDDKIISEGYNQVISQNDPTWHAEIQALRQAGQHLKSYNLNGCVLYASTQPCPMCLAASTLANIDFIFYGASNKQILPYSTSRTQDFFAEICKNEKEREIPSIQKMQTEALEIWQKFAKLNQK